MSTLLEIPELAGLDARRGLVRIPPELDVPLTGRVRQLIDTPEFRRLARISQLGLVSLVYPAAIHTRFEHCLGVYRLALLYLKQLAADERFTTAIRPEDAEVFIVSALLHDLGHWPFCHAIEDIRLPSVPSHELFANSFLLEGELADVLRHDWGINPREVIALLGEKPRHTASRILGSMLSGPIDIDKMDYLFRDSLHAGVPYGRNFDQQRLLGSLCLNRAGDGLAISDKGKTAAELMVFARYVMFSEVYWHHGVRSATAMLQRAFYLLRERLDFGTLFRLTEGPMIEVLRQAAGDGPAYRFASGGSSAPRRSGSRAAPMATSTNGPSVQQAKNRQMGVEVCPWRSPPITARTTNGVHGIIRVGISPISVQNGCPAMLRPPSGPRRLTQLPSQQVTPAIRAAGSPAVAISRKIAIPVKLAKKRRPRVSWLATSNSRQTARTKAGPTGPATANDMPAAA